MGIKVGDKVKLKSGGPLMTVKTIISEEYGEKQNFDIYLLGGSKQGDLLCQWFNGSKLEVEPFSPEGLERVE
jgi:uncharacterized protein YodC (DUF2158 family)